MRVVGVTLVSNAVTLAFPVIPAIRSILPLCDEVVVNLGPAEDGTRELVAGLKEQRVRFITGAWDAALGSRMLAVETQRALDAANGDWAVYIQADEVLHEAGLPLLRRAMDAAHGDSKVEALLVEYRHFYGGVEWMGTNRSWYHREARVVRLGAGVVSHGDAQGFRVGPSGRRVRARRTGAELFHYGWARPLAALRAKRRLDQELYHAGQELRTPIAERLPWQLGLRRFRGTHPAVAAEWVAARRREAVTGFARPLVSLRLLPIGLSQAVERLTGWRPFEHRNYVEI